ncbi:hypothetical protein EUGRSUZ_A01403 [Eucalyptus grandis]|uniref:Uncharacterized protein n=2 Tax=Eucalyptus grandis TaxID=71139 RepID=A0ACC3M4K1_EUCGR|nr:hypothetical protein EUGRSUZ_A01403 [Eucalyptus grandis]
MPLHGNRSVRNTCITATFIFLFLLRAELCLLRQPIDLHLKRVQHVTGRSSLTALITATSGVSLGFIFSDKGLHRWRTLPSESSWRDSTRTRPSAPTTRTETTLTVRIGGTESASEVSPSEISSQRLWTFLVPGLTPQEAKESEGSRGLSQSERDCGVAKRWRILGPGRDMVGIPRNRRGFKWQDKNGIFRALALVAAAAEEEEEEVEVVEEEEEEEVWEKRKRTERAVKKSSGRVALGWWRRNGRWWWWWWLLEMGCGGCDISTVSAVMVIAPATIKIETWGLCWRWRAVHIERERERERENN